MYKIKINDLEKCLDKKIRKNIKVIGFDIATRTGLCKIKTTKTYVYFDWTFLECNHKDINHVYYQMVNNFIEFFKDTDEAIIEDVHYQRNINTAIKLARFNGFALSEAIRKKIKWHLIQAVSARAKLNINVRSYGKGNAKKAVSDWILNNLGLKLDDNDIADAIILALLGIIENMDFNKKDKK